VTGDLWRVTSRHGVLADGQHGGWIDGWPGWQGLEQGAGWSGVFENGRLSGLKAAIRQKAVSRRFHIGRGEFLRVWRVASRHVPLGARLKAEG